jgi:hypothetical protein
MGINYVEGDSVATAARFTGRGGEDEDEDDDASIDEE